MQAQTKSERGGWRENHRLVLALLVLVVISNIPFGGYVLYPFELFSTWIHELCHGLAAVWVGGQFLQLQVFADTSGVAHTALPKGSGLARVVVSSAGYLGTTLFGVMMLFFQRPTRGSRLAGLGVAGVVGVALLWQLVGGTWTWGGGILTLALLLCFVAMSLGSTEHDAGRVGLGSFGLLLLVSGLFGRDLFTWVVLGGWCGVCWLLAWRGSERLTQFFFSFLAASCAIDALTSIRVLFSPHQVVNGAVMPSDASAVSSVLLLPAVVWSTLWMVCSVVMLWWALRRLWRAPTVEIAAEVEHPRLQGL